MDINEFKFIREPVKLSVEDYNLILQKMVSKLSKFPEIVSIYTFGNITVPGISDLDLIIITKANSKSLFRHYYLARGFSKLSKYIILHHPQIMDEYTAKNINFILPISNLKLVYGKSIAFRKKDKNCDIFFIEEYLNKKFTPPNILPNNNLIDVRAILNRISSFKYTLSLVEQTGGKNKWSELSLKIVNLKTNWFKLNNGKRRKIIVETAQDIIKAVPEIKKECENLLHDKAAEKKIISARKKHKNYLFSNSLTGFYPEIGNFTLIQKVKIVFYLIIDTLKFRNINQN